MILHVHDNGWENSGVLASLQRLFIKMESGHRMKWRLATADLVSETTVQPDTCHILPSWMLEPDFQLACSSTTVGLASQWETCLLKFASVVDAAYSSTHVLDDDDDNDNTQEEEEEQGDDDNDDAGEDDDDDDANNQSLEEVVARARMALGIALESYARYEYVIATTTTTTTSAAVAAATADGTTEDGNTAAATATAATAASLARLSSDSYFASLWTDSHAIFASSLAESDLPASGSSPSIKNTPSISSLPLMASTMEVVLNNGGGAGVGSGVSFGHVGGPNGCVGAAGAGGTGAFSKSTCIGGVANSGAANAHGKGRAGGRGAGRGRNGGRGRGGGRVGVVDGSGVGCKGVPATRQVFMALLCRCIQNNIRAWEPTLKAGLAIDSIKAVLMNAFLAYCLGMHQQILPQARPNWKQRHLIRTILQPLVEEHTNTVLMACSLAAKESFRILAASTLSSLPAHQEAYRQSNYPLIPSDVLSCCPMDQTETIMQHSSKTIVHAALSAAYRIAVDVSSRSAPPAPPGAPGGSNDDIPAAAPTASAPAQNTDADDLAILVEEISKRAIVEHRSKKHRSSNKNTGDATVPAQEAPAPPPEAPAVSIPEHLRRTAITLTNDAIATPRKMPILFASTSLPALRGTLVANELISREFRSKFIPFWTHAIGHGVRATRLDSQQYERFHEQSSTHRLTCMLSEDQLLEVHRIVATMHDSNGAGLVRLFESIGATDDQLRQLEVCNSLDTAIATISSFPATLAALFLAFAKFSAVKEKILSYDLGPETRRMQMLALRLRFDIGAANMEMTESELTEVLPLHATHLFLCPECGRVPNAVVDSTSKPVPHNELGLSQTMLRVAKAGCDCEIRCARRSSAALRTAYQKQEDASTARVEMRAVSNESIDRGLHENCQSGNPAKLRRDIKTCIEQNKHALACGDRPLIQINLVGKTIRVNQKWFSLCTYCGSVCRVTARMRRGSEICCLRCDAAMLSGGGGPGSGSMKPNENALMPTPPPPRPQLFASIYKCRFCSKVVPHGHQAQRFKVIRTPTDNFGSNAKLPPPLRMSCYCNSHNKTWLAAAHQSMDVRVVLSHLAEKATPVFGADGGRRDADTKDLQHHKRRTNTHFDKRLREAKRAKRAESGMPKK